MIPSYNPQQTWPPEEWGAVYERYREWSAWYSGDPLQISEALSGKVYTPTEQGRFWAKEIKDERKVMIHVPLAGELATTSSNFLFSETPAITIPGLTAEDDQSKKLRQLLDSNGFYNTILEAAEVASAIGGIFLKINWDKKFFPYPILNIAQPDNALPEFKFGILVAVTFWKIIRDDGDKVYRLLERHERGAIYTKLYAGTTTTLGEETDLKTLTETAESESVRNTGFKEDILVRYIPNMLPNKIFRGSAIGQSDFGGAEGLMDALDEAYTSWIRDIRIGVGRIITPRDYLRDIETGKPRFDLDQEVYEQLDFDPNDVNGTNSIKNIQFDIRHEAHQKTTLDLICRIISNAGYSPQSFGLGVGSSVNDSGYALQIKEKKSIITSAKKARYWKTALEDLLQMMMTIHTKTESKRPSIEINDCVSSDLGQIAISIRTKVKMVNRDWTEEQIKEEVKRITEEQRIIKPPVSSNNTLAK
jgi:TATA-box binding protein (TBP) (component of TFIID and TFIIIB)